MVERYENVAITSLDEHGRGVGRIDGMVVFCAGALPGDVVILRLAARRKNYAIATLESVQTPSPYRDEPPCPYFPECGGCTLQHMDYQAQLQQKSAYVSNCLQRIGGISDIIVSHTLGMTEPYHCRNKSAFPFGLWNGKPILGLYRQGTHDVVPIRRCMLQQPVADTVMNCVQNWASEHKMSVYNEKTGNGLLRHLLVRAASHSSELMVILVANATILPHIDVLISRLSSALLSHAPWKLASLFININTKPGNVILGDTCVLQYGEETIIERIQNLEFIISPLSFFQVNPKQTEVLYKIICDFAEPQPSKTMLDLHCGVGGIALALAQHGAFVHGTEPVAQAISNANMNAKRNNLEHKTRFIHSTAEGFLPHFIAHNTVDCVILDPPRKGCDAALLSTLCDKPCDRIVYTSCNPATLARDLSLLRNAYEVKYVQPVDMFCQSTHVECVVLMSRKEG